MIFPAQDRSTTITRVRTKLLSSQKCGTNIIYRVREGRFQEIGRNLGWLVGNRIFRMAVGVFVLGAVGRYLGPGQFGTLNYAISMATVLTAVATLGFEGIVIRELVRAERSTGLVLGTAFVMRIVGGIAAVILATILVIVTDGIELAIPTLIVAIGFLPSSFEVIDLWFQKNVQARYTVIARSAATLVGSGLKFALVLGHASLVLFAWSQVFDCILGAIALVWVYSSRGQRLRAWSFSSSMAKVLLRDCWPLILSGILVAVQIRIEQILVMSSLGKKSAGIYYSSVRVAEMWGFVPVMILATIYPMLVSKREGNTAIYKQKLQAVFDLIVGLGYVVAISVTLLGPFIIPLVFGPKYLEAVRILVIQAWTAPLTFSGSVRAQYFLLENLTIYHTLSAVVGIVTNLSVGLLLMPRLGAAGAALGALVGYCTSSYLTSLTLAPLRECATLQTKAFLVPFRIPALIAELGRRG